MSDLRELAQEEWDALLARLALDDVYFQSAYLASASLLGQGRPVFLHLGADGGDVVLPGLLRDGPEGYADLGTPMGYGGPLAAGAHPPVGEFLDAYDRWCAANRVVTTFVRFHPPLANQLLALGRWRLEHIGHSIGWRVGGRSLEELEGGLDSHHRRVARKGRKTGLEIRIEERPAELSEFVDLYEETMRRRDASSFYFFPEAYWEHVLGALGDRVVRADARLEDATVASILCLASPALLHYHLGASSERGQELGANHVLFLETASWAAARGFELFHLGGGVGGFEDSLYEFKRRFDPHGRLPAYLGKVVHDEAAYRELSGAETVDYAGYFPAYRQPG